jgi:uncharacterized membrane protein
MQDEQKQTTQEQPQGQGPAQPTPASTPVKNSTLMGILSYIGPLVIISYLTSKNDPFVKFHIKQGLVLLCIEVAIGVLGSLVWMFWPILQIVHFLTIVLSIIGIINVVGGETKRAPSRRSILKTFQHIKCTSWFDFISI